MQLPTLELISSGAREHELIESAIRRQVESPSYVLQILEAGCGQRWPLKLEGVNYSLTGIDIDAAALEIRKTKIRDLNHSVVGDLRSADILPPGKFAVIYNAYVLEHVAGAEDVLRSFAKWLSPNGIAIIKIPDPRSVRGFITKHTPHWVHLFYYRYIVGRRMAGKPGFGPYPTTGTSRRVNDLSDGIAFAIFSNRAR